MGISEKKEQEVLDSVSDDEIAETDKFILSLGKPGECLLEKIRDSGVRAAVFDPDEFSFIAAYDLGSNEFLIGSGLSLAERFNYRVHEGAHAIQAAAAPEVVRAVNNLAERKWEQPVIGPERFIEIKRLMEINAHAVQAYFNALAVNATGDKSFITCLRDDKGLRSFADLQERLYDEGRTPAEIRDIVASEFMKLAGPERAVVLEGENLGWGDIIDNFSLAFFAKLLGYNKSRLDSTRFITPSNREKTAILNAVMRLPESNRLMKRQRASARLHPDNRNILECIKTRID